MHIPGYDDWKLMTPDEDRRLCPVCGAYSIRECELREETDGVCPWEEEQDMADPDYLRDLHNERNSGAAS